MTIRTLAMFLCCAAFAASAEVQVKDGARIAFLGDSITAQGNSASGGYVNLVISGLAANQIKAVKIPAGVSGNKSDQMLARLKSSVLDKKPDLMLLSCGVNDVWHGARGIPLEAYKKNITEIVDRAQSAGVQVCIMTATMIREAPGNDANRKLAAYNDFLRKLAQEKHCLLADCNDAMQKRLAELKTQYPGLQSNILTIDGVHMNALGNAVMARCILRTIGLGESELAKAEAAWSDKSALLGPVMLTGEDLKGLLPKAAARGVSVREYVQELVAREAAAK